MFSLLTKPFRVAMLCLSVLNTGVAIVRLVSELTICLKKCLSSKQPEKLVAEEEKECEICQFCNENNPLDKSAEVEMFLFKSQLLESMTSMLSPPPSEVKWATLHPIASSFASGKNQWFKPTPFEMLFYGRSQAFSAYRRILSP